MSIAGELARFVTGTSLKDLPPLALERAKMVIASTIASAASATGSALPPSNHTVDSGAPPQTRRG